MLSELSSKALKDRVKGNYQKETEYDDGSEQKRKGECTQ